MSDKPKFPRADAIKVAKELCDLLRPFCANCISTLGHVTLSKEPLLKVCGSLRRRKQEVGDVEIVCVSSTRTREEGEPGLFETFKKTSRVEMFPYALDEMVSHGWLSKRLNKLGRPSWGDENRLAVHIPSGIPVDFFMTTFENWWMTVVIRTGPKEFNLRLIEAARKNGLSLNAYGTFTGPTGDKIPLHSEQEVFLRAGVPYLEPWERA